jgi:hypothetical protein
MLQKEPCFEDSLTVSPVVSALLASSHEVSKDWTPNSAELDLDEFMQLAIADPFSASPGDGREELTFREGQKQHLRQGTLSLGPAIRPSSQLRDFLVDLRTEYIDKDVLSIGCLLVS